MLLSRELASLSGQVTVWYAVQGVMLFSVLFLLARPEARFDSPVFQRPPLSKCR